MNYLNTVFTLVTSKAKHQHAIRGKRPFGEEEMLLHLLMRAALWLLVRVSMGPELSELRVASGLATGAVDFPLASPVQRRMNCSVGP